MKLRLPTFLCAALLACMACATTAHADTFLAEGVVITGVELDRTDYVYKATLDNEASDRFYDGGKGRDWSHFSTAATNIYYANNQDLSIFGALGDSLQGSSSYSLNFGNLTNDSGHCWAYTSSNMIQHWQSYYGVFANKVGETTNATPVHGYSYDKAYVETLGGTQSLKLNKLFYDNWAGSYGGTTSTAFSWYLAGKNDNTNLTGSDPGGYFSQYFTDPSTTNTVTSVWNVGAAGTISQDTFNNSIKSHFGYEQAEDGSWKQTTKGQIMYLELVKNPDVDVASSHAITCYGFDTDASGNITALYIVNSDDAQYKLVKVFGKLTSDGYKLYADETCTLPWNDWRVTGWSSINTPDVLKNMLAEYEKSNMIWMGNQDTWTNTQEADVNVLPTDETGWMAWSGSNTDHAGYYNTYYNGARGVVFNDAATGGTVNVAEDISTTTMAVNNNSLAYSFNGGVEQKTITTESFSKTGSGSVTFDNVKLVAGTATLEGDVTFDELEVTGTLRASDKTIHAKSITLGGDATIGAIGGENGENISGTTALTITGGTTKVKSDKWTNLKSLTMSGTAGLEVGASLNVADDITSSADMAQGGTANIKTGFCLKVGGDVNLAGNISSGAYIKIGGAANVTGNVTTTKDYIEIDGVADIGGNLNAGSATITLSKGGDVDGTLTGSTITLKDSTTMGSSEKVSIANGADLVVSGGIAKVEYSKDWTNLNNLTLSDQAQLNVAASVKVAGNLTNTTASTATLASGNTAGIKH